MVPATWVPWPFWSTGVVLPPRKLRLRAVSTLRSGCVKSMPVSITQAVREGARAAAVDAGDAPRGFLRRLDAAAAAGRRLGADRPVVTTWSCSQ